MTAASSRKGRSREEDKQKEDKDINVKHGKKKLSNKLSSSSSLHKTILNKLGPGIITGASDADPSGIALS